MDYNIHLPAATIDADLQWLNSNKNSLVKKINNPLGVGAGLQSVYQKNPNHPNTASGKSSVALGEDNTTIGVRAMTAAGGNNTASGDDSFVSGYHNEASGDTATATGHYTTASGKYSHTQGHATKATNESASAEGDNTEASGKYSHAQGLKTKATESSAHAQGQETIADASAAHAEGYKTHSSGVAAHAQGEGTQTTNRAEHAQGRYNVSRSGKTRSSIGIGTSNNARMNAFEVTEDGKIWILGAGGYTGLASLDLETAQDLAALLELQSDWNQSDNTKPDYIKNKPTFKTINHQSILGTGDLQTPIRRVFYDNYSWTLFGNNTTYLFEDDETLTEAQLTALASGQYNVVQNPDETDPTPEYYVVHVSINGNEVMDPEDCVIILFGNNRYYKITAHISDGDVWDGYHVETIYPVQGTGIYKVRSISQADYNNLGTYDASTLYVIY